MEEDELKARIAFLIHAYGRDRFTEVVEEVLNQDPDSDTYLTLLLLPKYYSFAIDPYLQATSKVP